MHIQLQKALNSALNDLDGVTDDIVKKRMFDPDAAQEGAESIHDVLGKEGEPEGVSVSKTQVTTGIDGKPTEDGTEMSPQEEEITGDMLEQLKSLLAK